jgi:putative transposase
VAPNTLKRGFNVSRPNRAWVTDITYVRTWEGWLYLGVVMDLYSRRIIGWATKPTLTRELVLDAILMAVKRRRPKRALIHSDQGSQYGSDDWLRFCRSHRLEPSMSRRGNCWDNAVAESFFSSLKKERIKKRIYRTRVLAHADIADYIEAFYNPIRRQAILMVRARKYLRLHQRLPRCCPEKDGKSRLELFGRNGSRNRFAVT